MINPPEVVLEMDSVALEVIFRRILIEIQCYNDDKGSYGRGKSHLRAEPPSHQQKGEGRKTKQTQLDNNND